MIYRVKKNLLLLLFSTIISLILLYIILYIYTFLNIDKNISYKFSSLEILNLHKNYSSKIHHLRLDEKSIKKKLNLMNTFTLQLLALNQVKKTSYSMGTLGLNNLQLWKRQILDI